MLGGSEAVADAAGALDAPPPVELRWRPVAVAELGDVVTAVASVAGVTLAAVGKQTNGILWPVFSA